MTTTEKAHDTGPPQIVKFDKALKLAEQWVNSMTKSGEDEATETELEGRPARVGLGAKVSRHTQFKPSDSNPVERRLYAKLDAKKRKAAKSIEDSDVKEACVVDEDDEDDSESRTSAFTKKRSLPVPSFQGKKKHK